MIKTWKGLIGHNLLGMAIIMLVSFLVKLNYLIIIKPSLQRIGESASVDFVFGMLILFFAVLTIVTVIFAFMILYMIINLSFKFLEDKQ